MTTFSVSLNDPGNVAGSKAGQISDMVLQAAGHWGQYLQGVGNIEIEVRFGTLNNAVAQAGPATSVNVGVVNGVNLDEPGTIAEIKDNVDPNGSSPDVIMTIDSSYVSSLNFGEDPAPGAYYVQAEGLFTHEIGHALGFISLLNSDGTASNFEYLLDQTITANASGQSFYSGHNALAAYGSPVPIYADGSHAHLDVDGDVMNSYANHSIYPGISRADLGVLQDAGEPIATERADLVSLGSIDDNFHAYSGNDTISGGVGNDLIYGNQGDDMIYGNVGQDTLFGGQGTDAAFGGQGSDLVYGNLGADVVYGNLGDDSLLGGQGDDVLFGGQGSDILNGNLGNDLLIGNLGADTFVFSSGAGSDLIQGFDQASGDRIDLQGQTYTVGTAPDGSALLTLSGGGTVDLLGLQPGQVDMSDFVSAST